MKKIILTALLSLGVTSGAFAHHMAANPDAGVNIPETSAHLDMTF